MEATYLDPSDLVNDQFKFERAVRRLAVAIELGCPLGDMLQMCDRAAADFNRQLDALAVIEWSKIVAPKSRFHAELRATVRRMAAVTLDAVPVTDRVLLAQRTWALIGNPNIVPAHVEEALFGRARHEQDLCNGELDVAVIREVARGIRRGMTVAAAAEAAGCAVRSAKKISYWMGWDAYRKDVLLDAAIDALAQGVSTAGFAEANGLPERTARTYMARARTIIDDGCEVDEPIQVEL